MYYLDKLTGRSAENFVMRRLRRFLAADCRLRNKAAVARAMATGLTISKVLQRAS